ncbi:MAG: hypothetical protein L3K07_00190 [Thermoplasmata archaeon]|nr:hypothetical protein [Thermoplasmata archaeon]
MESRRPLGSISFLLVALLLIPPSLGAGGSGPTAHAPQASSATGNSAGAHAWSPDSGLSSPGAPRDHLVTTQLSPLPGANAGFGTPAWLAFDAADSAFWVAVPPSSLDEIPANDTTRVAASVTVGGDPFGVAVDSATGNVFVTNAGSNTVSEVSPVSATVIGSLWTGDEPKGIAYDSQDSELYVANFYADFVSVYSAGGTSVDLVATIPVGHNPLGVAYDPASGKVFVANSGSMSVSVISPTRNVVVATLPAGAGPYGVAIDNATDNVYVTNEGSYNISVFSASSYATVASIPVVTGNIDLQGLAYDSRTGQMWVGAGGEYLVLVNTSTESVATYLTVDPSGVAYDPSTGLMCVTNTYNTTFECATVLPYGSNSANVTFTETGLPPGTTWEVAVENSAVQTSNTSQLEIAPCPQGPCVSDYYFLIQPAGGLVPTPATVWVNFTYPFKPPPISIGIAAGARLFNVTLQERGLVPGTGWMVDLDGVLLASTGGTLTVERTNGSYPVDFTCPNYIVLSHSSGVYVHGADANGSVNFSLAKWGASFSETGLPSGYAWYVNFTTGPVGFALPSSGPVTYAYANMVAPNGTYNLTVQDAGNLYQTTENRTVEIDSGRVLPVAATQVVFTTVSFSVEFQARGLPANAVWSVALDGTKISSTSPNITFTEPVGNYSYVVTTVAGLAAAPASGWVNFTIGPPPAVPILFSSTERFAVVFHETGLPSGTGWAIAIGSSFESSATSNVSFEELNGSYSYLVFDVPGYTTTYSGQFQVSGSAVRVVVPFLPQTYPVIVVEFGLPNGTQWSITVTNASSGYNRTYSTNGSAILFYLPNGTFDLSVGLPNGYTAVVSPSTFTVAGRVTTVPTVHASRTFAPTGPTPGTRPAGAWPLWLELVVFGGIALLVVAAAFAGRKRRPPTGTTTPPRTEGSARLG